MPVANRCFVPAATQQILDGVRLVRVISGTGEVETGRSQHADGGVEVRQGVRDHSRHPWIAKGVGEQAVDGFTGVAEAAPLGNDRIPDLYGAAFIRCTL